MRMNGVSLSFYRPDATFSVIYRQSTEGYNIMLPRLYLCFINKHVMIVLSL